MTDLIVALDGTSDKMQILYDRLAGELGVTNFKLRNRAFWQEGGLMLAKRIVRRGHYLMMDVKAYDTRDSVAGDVACLFDLGARFVTVVGDRRVLEAAGGPTVTASLLAVGPTTDRPLSEFNQWLEDMPIELCDGVICPPNTLPRWRKYLTAHSKLAVCPGIRPDPEPLGLGNPEPWAYVNDHASAWEPEGVVKAGADYLIIGRPIWLAPDPIIAARAILTEMSLVTDIL